MKITPFAHWDRWLYGWVLIPTVALDHGSQGGIGGPSSRYITVDVRWLCGCVGLSVSF